MSDKHLARYIGEFAGRHNARAVDTIERMALMAKGMMGKRLTYQELMPRHNKVAKPSYKAWPP